MLQRQAAPLHVAPHGAGGIRGPREAQGRSRHIAMCRCICLPQPCCLNRSGYIVSTGVFTLKRHNALRCSLIAALPGCTWIVAGHASATCTRADSTHQQLQSDSLPARSVAINSHDELEASTWCRFLLGEALALRKSRLLRIVHADDQAHVSLHLQPMHGCPPGLHTLLAHALRPCAGRTHSLFPQSLSEATPTHPDPH